jgi:trimeric autotransporter adhesin
MRAWPIEFWESNSTAGRFAALTITNTGSVGIGTATPSTKTDIHASPGTTPILVMESAQSDSATAPTTVGSAYYLGLGQNEYNSNSYRLIGFGYNEGLTEEYPAYIGYEEMNDASYTDGDLVFGTRSVTTNTTASERMRITAAGNVGIGTTAPSQALEVNGNAEDRRSHIVFRNDGERRYSGVH